MNPLEMATKKSAGLVVHTTPDPLVVWVDSSAATTVTKNGQPVQYRVTLGDVPTCTCPRFEELAAYLSQAHSLGTGTDIPIPEITVSTRAHDRCVSQPIKNLKGLSIQSGCLVCKHIVGAKWTR
jgi:hypothetical protein